MPVVSRKGHFIKGSMKWRPMRHSPRRHSPNQPRPQGVQLCFVLAAEEIWNCCIMMTMMTWIWPPAGLAAAT